ncbi:MAG: NAD(P)-dependent oxidoreductase [Desulfohalobiaceae bacterium]|nr:NAD(P)-dependent oxidoreductase [Desulfohalobiaceae bacterium]
MSNNIGIIGLGRCGMPAAKKFLESGYRVVGHARREEVISVFREAGGEHAASPAEVAKESDMIIVIVLNDQQVLDVINGSQGILQSARPGTLVICMSTINRENLLAVHNLCSEKGVDLVDCPFTGGPARVSSGTLTLICAAKPDLVEKARPHLELIGRITSVGEQPGMAQAVKHCNQLLVCTIHAATIELITLAQKTGVDPKLTCDVVGSGIGGNDYFRLLSTAILEDSPSPGGMGQLWKDVNIVVTSAREHNLPLLVADSASQYFNMAVSQNLANEDSKLLLDVLRRMIER